MTSFDQTTQPAIGGSGFAAAAGRSFAGFAAAMRRRAEITRSERRLRELPDHMLKDIGMHRSEIPAIVRFGRMEYGG